MPGGCREWEKDRRRREESWFNFAPTPRKSTLQLADENNCSHRYIRIASRTTALNWFKEMYVFIQAACGNRRRLLRDEIPCERNDLSLKRYSECWLFLSISYLLRTQRITLYRYTHMDNERIYLRVILDKPCLGRILISRCINRDDNFETWRNDEIDEETRAVRLNVR